MKKQLLTFSLLMGALVANAQVGIGTLDPNQSAQLDVEANDMGVLIPRVSLASVTDDTTIKNGNVESLLVYNKNNNDAISSGFYYWYEGEWRKLITKSDLKDDVLTSLSYDSSTDNLTYIDEDSVTHSFTLNNTKNSTIVLNGTTLVITDTDGNSKSVDLSSLTNTTYLDEGLNVSITGAGTVTSPYVINSANTINTSLVFDTATNNLVLTDSANNTVNANLSSLINTTKITEGNNITITGNGDTTNPYVINAKNTVIETATFDSSTNTITIIDSDKTLNIDLTELSKNTTITNITFDSSTNVVTVTDTDNNIINVDISGVLKAKNGLHVTQDKHVALGGDLLENTTIATQGNDLNITDLPQTDTSEGQKVMMVDNLTGKLRVADAKQIIDQNIDVEVIVNDNLLTVSVNNQSDSATIITSNTLEADSSTNNTSIVSTVNGVKSQTLDLKTIIQNGQKTTTIVDGVNTTVTSNVQGDNTEYSVNVSTASNTTLGVVKEAATNPTVFINTNGELSTTAWAGNNLVEVTADYQITAEDVVVFGNAGNDITITLPDPTGIKGRKLTIKKSDADDFTYVNVITSGTGNIEGQTDLYTSLPFTGWDLMSDGTNWKIVNKF